MPTKSLMPERLNTRVELIMLAAASLACVTFLTAMLASGRRLIEDGGLPGGTWLLAGLVAVAGMGTVYLVFRTLTVMRLRGADQGRTAGAPALGAG